MTPASKGSQAKRVSASRSTTTSRSGKKSKAARVGATATKRPALTKKKAAPVVKKAAHHHQEGHVDGEEGRSRGHEEGLANRQEGGQRRRPRGRTAAKKAAPVAKKAAPAKKTAPQPRRPRRRRRRPRRPPARPAANGAGAAPTPARTPFTPKPKPPAPVRPKTGPYAKDAKFLEEVRELLEADRVIYQEQATSLRAEADSLALEREPGDVQFDEESGEGGTVTVDRERNLALSGQATLAVEEIDDALAAHQGQDLRVLRALLPAHPEAEAARPPVRPPLRGVQERGTVPALTRPRVLAFAIAVVVVVVDRITTRLAEDHLHDVQHVWGPFGLALTFNSGFAFSLFSGRAVIVTVLLCVGVVVLAWVVAQVRSVPLAIGAGLVLGGAVGNLSERIVGATAARYPTSSRSTTGRHSTSPTRCVTVGVIIVIVALLFGRPEPAVEPGNEGG